MRRSEGIADLLRNGNHSVWDSDFGRTTADLAAVAWRVAYVWSDRTCEELDHTVLDWAMRQVINEPWYVRQLIREHGHRMYR
jgi:hypothetical protein